MSPDTPAIQTFLERVERDHNARLRQSCLEVIESLPPGTEFNPAYVLVQAKLRLQEERLQDLAVMNATAFYHARKKDR
jgi:hypothetical protein